MEEPELQKWPQNLSPCNSITRRRRSNDVNSSPEFEFWMVRNPSFPQPDLHSADELFSDGIILPLHQLHHHSSVDPPDQNHPPPPPTTTTHQKEEEEPPPSGSTRTQSEPGLGPEISSGSSSTFTSSKRWKDLFKKSDNNNNNNSNNKGKEKEKKKEKKSGGANVTGGVGNSGVTAAELNINIWPFRRSRSAGNGGNRPRMAAMPRKVSSAPCSRSNSAGESKSRKWPSSPSRGGVHLGRSSPVWQVRRISATAASAGGRTSDAALKSAEKGVRKEGNQPRLKNTVSGGTTATAVVGGGSGGGTKARVLNLNVPMCIGYRHHLSCRSDENSAISVAAAATGTAATTGGVGGGGGQSGGAGSNEGVRGSNLFNIRSLFTKKVY